MTIGSLKTEALVWFGVFGAPFAWATQHVAGFAVATATCTPGGPDRSLAINTVTIAVTVPCLLIAAGAIAAAGYMLRETRDAGEYDPPPKGRMYFLSVVGLTIGPLFVFIMLLSGWGVLDGVVCRQS